MWSSCLKTSSTISSARSPEARARLRRVRARRLREGLRTEWHETRAIPGQLLRGEFRRAGAQLADLGRMGFLAALWALPGGAIVSALVVRFSIRIRPSAFREKPIRKRV